MNFRECVRKGKVIKKRSDSQMARSLLLLATTRENDIDKLSTPTLKVESLYEIIKELITGLLACHGYKSYSHECLVAFMKQEFPDVLSAEEAAITDQLRIIRHDIANRGIFVEHDYLLRNEMKLKVIITMIKAALEDMLREREGHEQSLQKRNNRSKNRAANSGEGTSKGCPAKERQQEASRKG
ncbi:TPA: hypothetical protein HA361_04350 [Candidatus Woesearchaeota archaeon]|nr:hypothetical protein [Candidatus Woesearchaeota archaeon]